MKFLFRLEEVTRKCLKCNGLYYFKVCASIRFILNDFFCIYCILHNEEKDLKEILKK